MALDFKKSFCSKSKFGTFGHWRLPDAFPLPTQSEAKKLVSTKISKNSVQFNVCCYSSSLFENSEFSRFWSC